MLNPHIPSIERQIFERFLQEVKTLMEQKRIAPPSGFISYAWEAPADGPDNKKLQAWLGQLKQDFDKLGIDLFLDIQNINGDMRAAMQEIKSRDFVFLIGTPRFKEKTEQDTLYLLPTFNLALLPVTGNAVVMVENSEKIYVVEIENHQPVLKGEASLTPIDVLQIEWRQERGYQRAKCNVYVNEIIEKARKQVLAKTITNVAYEFGLASDKLKQSSQSLMSLLYQGEFDSSFPKDISSDVMIRNFKEAKDYYRNIVSINPLGLLPAICPALQKDKDYEKLVNGLLEWKFDIWKETLSHQFHDELQLYIPARGDCSPRFHNPKAMMDHVSHFINHISDKVLLLLGDSGSGKTLFGQYLLGQVLQLDYIPIWISLPGLKNPKENAILEGLSHLGVPEVYIESFKEKPLLIILDAYDEVANLGNLYDSNHLEKWPNAKVIITCRPEFLTAQNYNRIFKPRNGTFIERYIVPFSSSEITEYLKKYVDTYKPIWPLSQYQAEIEALPSLKSLIETPFILKIVAEALPKISDKYHGEKAHVDLTRRALYEQFMSQWFEKHITRWSQQNKLPILDDELDLDKDDEMGWDDKRIEILKKYAQNFAYHLFLNKISSVSMSDEYPWVKEFFDNKPRAKLIRSSCPLKKLANDRYEFIHSSIFEYLVSSHRNALSIERLNQHHLSDSLINFFRDAITENPDLQKGLWDIIDSSKQSDSVAIAASNAITILNRAKTSFSGKNLANICIPNADLSKALLDNTNLEGADLTSVKLNGAWLHGVNLKHAKMSEVVFRELPSLNFYSKVEACCYSSDGSMLAIAYNYYLYFQNANSFEDIALLKETDAENRSWWTCLDFSFDSQYLVSGSKNKTVQIWVVKNKSSFHTLNGHQDEVTSVHCSPNDLTVISGSRDKTVKLWGINRGELLYTFEGLSKCVFCVKFSPDGKIIAGSSNGILNFWSVESRALLKSLSEEIDTTRSNFDFSCDGQWLAMASSIEVVLWSVKESQIKKRISTQGVEVTSVKFSLDSKMLAFSARQYAQLYSIERGELLNTYETGGASICDIHFNPNKNILTSACWDGNVRFWMFDPQLSVVEENRKNTLFKVDLSLDGLYLAVAAHFSDIHLYSMQTKLIIKTFEHFGVECVKFSSSSKILASGGRDIKIWLVGSGDLISTFDEDRSAQIEHLSFSANDQMLLSSSSDKKIKLWSIKNSILLKTYETKITPSYAQFSSDNKSMAFIYSNTEIKLWALETDSLIRVLNCKPYENFQKIKFNVTSSVLVAAIGSQYGDELRFWSVRYGDNLGSYKANDIVFSPCGKMVAYRYETSLLEILDNMNVVDSIALPINAIKVSDMVFSMSIMKNGNTIVLVTGHTDTFRCWHLIKRENKSYLQLEWAMYQNALLAQDACIKGVIGLSENNKTLLIERGATEPRILNQSSKSVSQDEHDSSHRDNLKSKSKYKNTAQTESDIKQGYSLGHLNQQLLPLMMIEFLADALKAKPELQSELWSIIVSTRQNENNAIAAANAMMILNKAKIAFSGKDLSHIRIPGAILSGAILDNTNLEGADLRNVNLSGAWLQSTNFSQAMMAGIELGEYPSLFFKDAINSCCYSPDGHLLAVAVEKEVQLFDATNRTLVSSFKGHTDKIGSVAFSVDGKIIATGSWDHTAKLWTVDGVLQKTLVGHTDKIGSVSFSFDGKIVATGSWDHTAKLWTVDGVLQKTLVGHTKGVNTVAFAFFGQIIATGSWDNTVKMWNMETGELQKTIQAYSNSVAFSVEGIMATGSDLWRIMDGVLQKKLEGHAFIVTSVAFSADGKILATGSDRDKTVKLWTVDGVLQKTLVGHTGGVNTVAFSTDGKIVATGGEDATVKLWNVQTSGLQKSLEEDADFGFCMVFSPDGKKLAIKGQDYTVKLWDTETGVIQQTLEGHTGFVDCVAFSVDGKILATGSSDHTAKLWNRETGELQKTIEGHTCSVTSIAFSIDGKILATGSDRDHTVKLWNMETIELQKTIKWLGDVTSIAFSVDGKILATGSRYKETVKLWDTQTGKLQKTLEGHTKWITCVAFSVDGKIVATGSRDETAKLWDMQTGKLQKTLDGHIDSVTCLAFSPDGKILATGSEDNTIRLWWDFSADQKSKDSVIEVISTPNTITFYQNNQGTFLGSVHTDHSLRWMVLRKDSQPYLQLFWSTQRNELLASKAYIEGVQGLSKNNADLLLQRGAIGKPLMLSETGRNASTSNKGSASESSRRGEAGSSNNSYSKKGNESTFSF